MIYSINSFDLQVTNSSWDECINLILLSHSFFECSSVTLYVQEDAGIIVGSFIHMKFEVLVTNSISRKSRTCQLICLQIRIEWF